MRHSAMGMALVLAATPALAAEPGAPAGDYVLDKAHASLVLRLSHMGFSNYTARFSRFDTQLKFDPANPAAMQVEAQIDAKSLDADGAPAGFMDALKGPQWLDTAKYPTITFRSTKVQQTSPTTARVTGDFTLHGVTKPVILDATFNGGYPGMQMDPHGRVGFSAHGVLQRSAFGISYGVPPAGSRMGVGDEVSVTIEAELIGPPLAKAKPSL